MARQLHHYPSSSSFSMVKDETPTPNMPSDEHYDADRHSPASKRRPSRAGMRSVNTLSSAQLERKRANDREAQRAIRARTKEHIDALTKQVEAANARADQSERLLLAAQYRNRQLEQELTFIKTRASAANESFIVGIPNNEVRAVDSAISLSSDTSTNTDPFMQHDIPQVMTDSHRGSLVSVKNTPMSTSISNEPWPLQQRQYSVSPAVNARQDVPRTSTSWRSLQDSNMQLMTQASQMVEQISRPGSNDTGHVNNSNNQSNTHNGHDVQQWTSDSAYGYMLDASQTTPQQTPSKPTRQQHPRSRQQSLQERSASGQYALTSSGMNTPHIQHRSLGYNAALNTPSLELSSLSMQSPALTDLTALPTTNVHVHDHSMHSAYTVASGPPLRHDYREVSVAPDMIPQPQQYLPAVTSNNAAFVSTQNMSHQQQQQQQVPLGYSNTNNGHQNYDYNAFYAASTQ